MQENWYIYRIVMRYERFRSTICQIEESLPAVVIT